MNGRATFPVQSAKTTKTTPIEENRGILVGGGNGNGGGAVTAMHEVLRSSESVGKIIQNATPNVLQYHSYNPKNPGVYKIETTPVAFTSDYNPIEEIYRIQKYAPAAHKVATQKISSSSSDSLHHHHQKYTKPMRTNYYDCSNELIYNQQLRPQIYKTDSKASILSEMSIKSENSNHRYYKQAEMSDSSMGDSMFSYPAQRRYYGSAESCQFGYECQPCGDGDKCSFSDNCRYECRNCDCSSSYFSSDFDDGNFSRKGSARMSHATSQISNYNDDLQQAIDLKATRYAEDFMKHLNNVKKTCSYQTAANAANQTAINTVNNQMHAMNNVMGRDAGGPPPDYGSLSKQKVSSGNGGTSTTAAATKSVASNAPTATIKSRDPSDDASSRMTTISTLSKTSNGNGNGNVAKSDSNGNKTTAISTIGKYIYIIFLYFIRIPFHVMAKMKYASFLLHFNKLCCRKVIESQPDLDRTRL